MRKFLTGAFAAATLALAGSAQAATYIFSVSDPGSGLVGTNFGSVDVTDTVAGADFVVTLAAGYQFRFAPDGNHHSLTFLLPTASDTDILNLTPTVFYQNTNDPFSQSPFGNTWNRAIDCTEGASGQNPTACRPGFGPNPTTMSFSIAGINESDFGFVTYGDNHIFFSADITNAAGKTGNVGATLSTIINPGCVGGTCAVPEPSSWALLIVGFGGVGGLLRTRRAKLRAAFA